MDYFEVDCWRTMRYFFFFNDTATTEIYTLSLHDALPILVDVIPGRVPQPLAERVHLAGDDAQDRKSTRLNSSHLVISYAVFCLKKKNKIEPAQSYFSPRCRDAACCDKTAQISARFTKIDW